MNLLKTITVLSLVLMAVVAAAQSAPQASSANVFAQQEGFVDANGIMIYYKILGRGEPLMIVHGGPGASHDYFLPYLLPLARRHKLIFIDERGSGRSQKLEDPAGYMIAAWGEGYFPYLYHNRPDPNYDPVDAGKMSWELYREMWGSDGEFVIDGNLKSVEYTDRLSSIKVPTLILVGDHDECDPSLAKVMQEKISGSKLVIFPSSGHMTFVDQPGMFVKSVDGFLNQR